MEKCCYWHSAQLHVCLILLACAGKSSSPFPEHEKPSGCASTTLISADCSLTQQLVNFKIDWKEEKKKQTRCFIADLCLTTYWRPHIDSPARLYTYQSARYVFDFPLNLLPLLSPDVCAVLCHCCTRRKEEVGMLSLAPSIPPISSV